MENNKVDFDSGIGCRISNPDVFRTAIQLPRSIRDISELSPHISEPSMNASESSSNVSESSMGVSESSPSVSESSSGISELSSHVSELSLDASEPSSHVSESSSHVSESSPHISKPSSDVSESSPDISGLQFLVSDMSQNPVIRFSVIRYLPTKRAVWHDGNKKRLPIFPTGKMIESRPSF